MEKLIDTKTITSEGGIYEGIFQFIYSISESYTELNLPWLTLELTGFLDKDYYLVHSGDKYISKQYARLRKLQEDGTIEDADMTIAEIIVNRFKTSWNKIYDAIVTEYSPLENYNMEQTETPDITHKKTVKSKVTTDNGVYGFNSNAEIPQSKSVSSGLKSDNEEENTETGTRDLTRHGNIGVTTSQQMLQAEIDLRSNYHFINQIMNDVDSILCLLVY